MSKYQLAHKCDKCKKVYSDYKFLRLVDMYIDGICPKCGCKGRIYKVVAKPKLFGMLGWKVKEEE